ncbi:LPS export ABC transporter periplasmic protein LptC [Govanella unica]|uniref:LPS export ABC transporter periplasmic protein LptC n=1 Tax=Govanella unica TaxID=2975056 RepID=A0A9X3TWE0_9PROT|nr:LPS export ABC transporter periplasmic protein LptC [Govania unica]MDA5192988.1 LPS export ABC transporter periplasmic protein LptC [Govania unica]
MTATGSNEAERRAAMAAARAAAHAPQADGSTGDEGADRLSRFFAVRQRGDRESAERSRILKKILPWVTGVVLVALLSWPFINQHSESITLSYKDLIGQSEQVRIKGAHYTGVDARDRPFEVMADEGLQERTDSDYATLTKVEASMELSPQDKVAVTGGTGKYDRAKERLSLASGITLDSSTGYKLQTDQAEVDLATKVASGTVDVTGSAPFGSFSAKGFTLKLDDRQLTLEGNVKVKLDPGKRMTDRGKAGH